MTLYDVELWADVGGRPPGVYLYTLSGPFTDQDAAEHEAAQIREGHFLAPNISVQVIAFHSFVEDARGAEGHPDRGQQGGDQAEPEGALRTSRPAAEERQAPR